MQIILSLIGDNLTKQLKKQKINFSPKIIKGFEEDNINISRLKIRGFLTDLQGHTAKNRLFKKIKKHVEEMN